MRPMLSAVVVALVLLTAAFLFVAPTAARSLTGPGGASPGLRTAVAPTYGVGLDVATEPVLPGYHDTLYYEVLNNTNGAPVSTGLSSITILGSYYNTLDKLIKLPGTPASVAPNAPIGSWAFQVPANTSSNVLHEPLLTVWANSSSMGMNVSNDFAVEVGNLQIFDARVCGIFSGCGTLTTGAPATVSFTAYAEDGFGDLSPAANETVSVLFYSTGSSPVTVPGVAASYTTNAQGEVELAFTPSSTIFNVPGPNHVEIEVTDSVNASLSVYDNVTWHLYNPTGITNFAFALDHTDYFSGDTVVASWQWAGTNSSVGTWNVTNYVVYDDASGNIIASGLVGSTAPSGSFHFALPSMYFGDFEVEAAAYNSSDFELLDAGADASQAIFAVVPSEFYFNPGDVITVTITEEGPALTGASISAYVQATNSGQTLFNGPVTGMSFQFTVPMVAPADIYDIAAWANTSAGTVAAGSTDVELASGWNFWAGVSSTSSYADGSFTPGTTIQLSYAVTVYGTSTPPRYMEIYVFPGSCSYYCITGTPSLKSWAVTSASGSVPFTIPSSTPNGLQAFTVVAEWPGGEGSSQLTVNVNSAPSALNYELGAGSGLTVGWLILLLLIIIVAIVLVMMGRRSKPTMVMSPAASTTPEWKEPAGGASTGGSSGTPPTPPSSQ